MLHLSVSYCLDMDRISFYPSEHLFLKALDACFSFFSFFYWKFIRKIIKTTLEFECRRGTESKGTRRAIQASV